MGLEAEVEMAMAGIVLVVVGLVGVGISAAVLAEMVAAQVVGACVVDQVVGVMRSFAARFGEVVGGRRSCLAVVAFLGVEVVVVGGGKGFARGLGRAFVVVVHGWWYRSEGFFLPNVVVDD